MVKYVIEDRCVMNAQKNMKKNRKNMQIHRRFTGYS